MTSPWTPEPPGHGSWNVEAPSSGTWTPEPRPFGNWSVANLGSTRRITEAAVRRITEAGAIRIIERHTFKWTIPLASPNPWQPT